MDIIKIESLYKGCALTGNDFSGDCKVQTTLALDLIRAEQGAVFSVQLKTIVVAKMASLSFECLIVYIMTFKETPNISDLRTLVESCSDKANEHFKYNIRRHTTSLNNPVKIIVDDEMNTALSNLLEKI